MGTKKPYTWYLMEKKIMGTTIKGGRVRVKGEVKRKDFESRGYEVVDKVEVK